MKTNDIKLASLLAESIVDGPGLRLVLFTQGCPHRCPGCHNPDTHLQVGGRPTPLADILALYDKNPLLRGITLSGGEPFLQGASLAACAAEIHRRGGDVLTYSGFTHSQLRQRAGNDPAVAALLAQTDLLIDGPYLQDLRTVDLPFRGSRNQRLIALTSRGETLLSDIEAQSI